MTASLLLMGAVLLLAGCGKTTTSETIKQDPSNTLTQNQINSPAFKILENIAKDLGKPSSAIQATDIERKENQTFPGFTLTHLVEEDQNLDTSSIFEGWLETGHADGPYQSLVWFLKEKLFCRVESGIQDEELIDRLLELDRNETLDEKSYEEQYTALMDKAKFSLKVSCGSFPETEISPAEIAFSAWGSEPFWSAELRGGNIIYTTPEDKQYLAFNSFKKTNDGYEFEGFRGLKGTITKTECTDDGIGEKHDYTLSLSFHTYEEPEKTINVEGCADAEDPFFIVGRQGKLNNFIKKTHYRYEGELDPKKLSYMITNSIKNYLEVTVSQENYEHLMTIVFEKGAQGREKLREGNYPVDEETCEKHASNEVLMDF